MYKCDKFHNSRSVLVVVAPTTYTINMRKYEWKIIKKKTTTTTCLKCHLDKISDKKVATWNF